MTWLNFFATSVRNDSLWFFCFLNFLPLFLSQGRKKTADNNWRCWWWSVKKSSSSNKKIENAEAVIRTHIRDRHASQTIDLKQRKEKCGAKFKCVRKRNKNDLFEKCPSYKRSKMNYLREFLYRPKRTDRSLMARFYFADEALTGKMMMTLSKTSLCLISLSFYTLPLTCSRH